MGHPLANFLSPRRSGEWALEYRLYGVKHYGSAVCKRIRMYILKPYAHTQYGPRRLRPILPRARGARRKSQKAKAQRLGRVVMCLYYPLDVSNVCAVCARDPCVVPPPPPHPPWPWPLLTPCQKRTKGFKTSKPDQNPAQNSKSCVKPYLLSGTVLCVCTPVRVPSV